MKELTKKRRQNYKQEKIFKVCSTMSKAVIYKIRGGLENKGWTRALNILFYKGQIRNKIIV